MSLSYRAIGWNRQKRIYDGVLVFGVALYLGLFLIAGTYWRPEATAETLLIRGLGTAAILLVHVVLSIGPLCRLDSRFLPLLYNRRHLGVTTFVLGAAHAGLAIFQFHAMGDLNPLVSVLVANTRFDSLSQFPFQVLGLAALLILFLMAATSHDFWLANLTAPIWKTLHMLVYVAYGLLVLHVTLGVLQAETSPILAATLGTGLVWVLGLHLVAGIRERKRDRESEALRKDGFVEACAVEAIRENRARIVSLAGERVAIFKYDGKISAVSNVCQHQNGPLGEGKVVDGCITCPWHGFQYLPESGESPPPFTEKIPTFEVRVREGHVWVDPRPNLPGTRVEPAVVPPGACRDVESGGDEFYVGYLERAPRSVASRIRFAVASLLLLAPALAVALIQGQSAFDPSRFEWGVVRQFEGIALERPQPVLLVPRPGEAGNRRGFSQFILVGLGKFGARQLLTGLEGQAIRFDGSLIYRDGQTMIQIESETVSRLDSTDAVSAPRNWADAQDLGERTLTGEVVDTKCWFGVMKPGRAKPHRACAVRCISGGVPPALLVRDPAGAPVYYWLVSRRGEPLNREILDVVAERVQVSGHVIRLGEMFVLRTDRSEVRRLTELRDDS